MSSTDITDHASSVETPAQNEIKALCEETQLLKQQNKGNLLILIQVIPTTSLG